ncbi:MAG: IS1182 family transposase [Acidimicrobiales bacterium]
MQGHQDPDRQLLDAEALCRSLVEPGTVCAFLADHRHELFKDEDFADLFAPGRGRPSVPAALVCSVMVLQALEGQSDRDAMRQLRTRIDWKVACGLSLDDEGFDFTVLTYWRTRLRRSARPQRIFDAVREVVAATGVLSGKHRRALDSTILDDAVATQDTVTQLISAIAKVRRLVPAAAAVGLGSATDDGTKPIIDWSDTTARHALVTALVADADAVANAAQTATLSEAAGEAVGLLALIAGQDVEPGEVAGTWRIAKKVAKDRVISTVDVEARHGHKSTAVRKDGFKAHLAVEPDTGIVTAVAVSPANHPDGPAGVGLMDAEPDGLEILADSAYGSGPTRAELHAHHHRLVIKPLPSRPAVPGGFVRDDFAVDHLACRVTCPAGHVAAISAAGSARFAPHCASCPLRARCTKATARSFSVSVHDAELVEARAAWVDEEVRATYRRHRPMAERAISWLVAKGNRRLRYRGVEANEAWAHRRVAALNLRRLVVLGLSHKDGTWMLAGG